MSQLGIGSMLHLLSGGSDHAPSEFYGRQVVKASLNKDTDPERMELSFADGTVIHIWDGGQSCCEQRYITCEDELNSLVGGKLVAIEAKPGPDTEDEYGGCHEQVFVDIRTDKGFVTFTTHNEHNGYYGGFGLTITEERNQ